MKCTVCLLLLFSASSVHADEGIRFKHVVVDQNGPTDMHAKTTGDLNGDGLVDLVVAGTKGAIVWYEYPAWTKHVIANRGGGWSCDAEAGDIDRDGDQDIVISDWYQNNRLVWFENPGQGGKGDWSMHLMGKPRAHDIALGDLDRDGDFDVVTRQQGSRGDRFEVWLQRGPKSWNHRTVKIVDGHGEGLTIGDLDRDGDPDVIIGGRWYETPDNTAEAAWTEHVFTTTWKHKACVVETGDFNKDGRLDVVISPSERRGGKYRVAWFEAPPR